MIPKKSPVSHTIPTCSIPNLPNIEKDLIKSTGVILAKILQRLSQKRAPTMLESKSFREIVRTFFLRVFGFL